jgi:hypothetical protein
MQQKYLWGGASLFVLGAATAYFTVDYAARHPSSMVARIGMATVLSGLHSHPLGEAATVITNEPPHFTKGQSLATGGPRPDPAKVLGNPAEETIEPIQVETVPPPTKEPPLKIDDDEWTSIVEAAKAHTFSLRTSLPQAMPYADELVTTPGDVDDASNTANTIFHALHSSILGWVYSLAPMQLPDLDVLAPTIPSAPQAVPDGPPLTDTMEFRPSDAGRYPLGFGNPF